MKKVSCVLLALLMFAGVSAHAETEKLVFPDNEYGGVTKQINYSKGDPNFERGILRVITHYDGKGKKKKIELYATESHANQEGWYRRVTYYWGKSKVSEAYATDSHSANYGFNRMASYYDERGNLEKREYYIRDDALAAKAGIYKRVVRYDRDGNETSVEDLDKLGNVLRRE